MILNNDKLTTQIKIIQINNSERRKKKRIKRNIKLEIRAFPQGIQLRILHILLYSTSTEIKCFLTGKSLNTFGITMTNTS